MRLPDGLTERELLEILDDFELAELASVAFRSGDLSASAICLRALRRLDEIKLPPDPDQLALALPPSNCGAHHAH